MSQGSAEKLDGANPSGDLSGKGSTRLSNDFPEEKIERDPKYDTVEIDPNTMPEDVRMVRTRAEFEELQRRLGTYQVIKESEEKAQRKWERDNRGARFLLGAVNRTGGILQIVAGIGMMKIGVVSAPVNPFLGGGLFVVGWDFIAAGAHDVLTGEHQEPWIFERARKGADSIGLPSETVPILEYIITVVGPIAAAGAVVNATAGGMASVSPKVTG